MKRWPIVLCGLGFVVLAVAHAIGLFVAPREAMMGDVGRILYVHVPTAWVGMVAFGVAFVAAVGALWTGRRGWDALVEGSVEVGVLLSALLIVQGSIWARPTWGVYWTWDPRLTTAAVMLIAFAVVLILRAVIDQPEQRLVASSVATVVAFVDVPIVYFSVKWWRTLHQPFSTPNSIDSPMIAPLLIALVGMTLLGMGLIGVRTQVARARLDREDAGADLPDLPDQMRIHPPSGEGGEA